MLIRVVTAAREATVEFRAWPRRAQGVARRRAYAPSRAWWGEKSTGRVRVFVDTRPWQGVARQLMGSDVRCPDDACSANAIESFLFAPGPGPVGRLQKKRRYLSPLACAWVAGIEIHPLLGQDDDVMESDGY